MRKLACILALVAACQSEQEAAAPHPDGGMFKEVVASQQGRPLDARLAVYRPLAEGLELECMPHSKKSYLHGFADDLVLVRDFEALDALEAGLDDEIRKSILWDSVDHWKPDPERLALLEKWALRNPESILLARFRPGGIEFLLATVEDESRGARDRAACLFALRQAGDASVIPRLENLVDDPSPVRLRSARAGSDVPTLGEIARRTIEYLQSSD